MIDKYKILKIICALATTGFTGFLIFMILLDLFWTVGTAGSGCCLFEWIIYIPGVIVLLVGVVAWWMVALKSFKTISYVWRFLVIIPIIPLIFFTYIFFFSWFQFDFLKDNDSSIPREYLN